MEPYWSEANGHAPHSVKYESEAAVSSFPYCTESSLNFSTSATAYSEDDTEYATGRRNKTSRQDPLSHRIIEKRRRDRMNSCLADLSRLIPPQYQRKGRGRIEKTEIIEMAIRHLKHLQNECILKENEYRMGYMDCMKEAAKFLYDSQLQDCLLARLLTRLQEHCEEVLKNDCFKSRVGSCHAPDNVSGSSGSPHQSAYHAAAPLCQLRDMLGSAASASDIEHSNDHNDVKDLSFRNHLNQLQRAVAASAAAAAAAAMNNNNNNNNNNNTSTTNKNNSEKNNSSTVVTTLTEHASNNNNINNNNNSNKSPSPPQQQQQQQQQTQLQKSQQTPVITSTGGNQIPAAHQATHAHAHHMENSNHDYECSRETTFATAVTSDSSSQMHSPPPPPPTEHCAVSNGAFMQQHQQAQQPLPAHINHHSQHSSNASDSALSLRLRHYSECSSSHEILEHNNNYKYKNHIKERFNHELEEHEDEEDCSHSVLLHSDNSHGGHAPSEHSKDGTEPEIAPIIAKKRKMAEAMAEDTNDATCHAQTMPNGRATEKLLSFVDIKSEISNSATNAPTKLAPPATTPTLNTRNSSFAVPIFALHGQGSYYVPLNVDYNVLVPFLQGMDLLEKHYMPVVHPININVNFMPPTSNFLAAVAAGSKPQVGVVTAPVNVVPNVATVAAARAKIEATFTNGW